MKFYEVTELYQGTKRVILGTYDKKEAMRQLKQLCKLQLEDTIYVIYTFNK